MPVKHFELMKQYLDLCERHDEPWKFVRWRAGRNCHWMHNLNDHPRWTPSKEYEIIPETVTRTITYPKPITEGPAGPVWVPHWKVNNSNKGEVYAFCYENEVNKREAVKAGLAQATEQAALEHAKVLFGGGE